MTKLKIIWFLLFSKEYFVLVDKGTHTYVSAIIKNNPLMKSAYTAIQPTGKNDPGSILILNHLN